MLCKVFLEYSSNKKYNQQSIKFLYFNKIAKIT